MIKEKTLSEIEIPFSVTQVHNKENKTDIINGKLTEYEDVKHETTERYFNGNQFSIDAFRKKYTLADKPEETYVQAIKRVCDFVASVENTDELKKYWSKRWFNEIYNDWWHPAGSIMQGAGSGRKISLANCSTNSLGALKGNEEWDSLEAIIKNATYTIAKSAAYRQGTGIDFSRLRPKDTEVMNSARKSTGSIHWMQFVDQIGNYVGQSGRIPALLFSLSCKHPDVEELIGIKADRTRIQNANISIQCTDDFYDAVKKDKNWELSFEVPEVKKGQKVYVDEHSITRDCKKDEEGWYYIARHTKKKEVIKKTVRAKELMELIAKNMHAHAEPGIQNIDMARKYSNSDYVYDPKDECDSRIISTNACSEQYLSRESLCILSSINCEKFSTSPDIYEHELRTISHSINRFLDNVNECELEYQTYATPHQRIAIEKLRRTGAGVTNIAGWLFKQNTIYGSEKSSTLMEHFMQRYAYHLYDSSINIGKEKGSFKLFNREKLEKSPFIQRMMSLGLEFPALRNVTLISIAPTGSLSLMFRDLVMSYGVEPAFGIYYWKRTRMNGKYEYYFNVPHVVRDVYKNAGFEIPIDSDSIKDDWKGSKGKKIAEFIELNRKNVNLEFKQATDIRVMDKLELMSKLMQWVDSSISVTYMLPEKSTSKDVFNFIMAAYEKGVKSIAAFPDKKMYGIISFIPFEDLARKLIHDGTTIHPQNFSKEELSALAMSEESVMVHNKNAPKRPETLDADIYSVTVNKEKFVIVIGLNNKYPYEIFGGKMNGLKLDMDAKHMEGKITKVSRGQYALEFEEAVIRDFSKQFTPVEKNMFRMLSLSLRHGIPIEYIVEQMNKASDDMFSVSAAVGRVLKKYIRDGKKVNGSGCPSCGGALFYNDGCVQCSCGYSGCS
jgi:ribonucleoside-diphosphate reductase alpha chain